MPCSCLHCGAAVAASQSVCPNCGFVHSAAWPPAPAGQTAGPSPPVKLATRSEASDILLGTGLSAATFLVCGTGVLVVPILCFALRRYPILARYLGFGWLAGTVLLLGLLAACYQTSQGTSQPWQSIRSWQLIRSWQSIRLIQQASEWKAECYKNSFVLTAVRR